MSDRGAEILAGAAPIEFSEDAKWWSDLAKAYNMLCRDKPEKPADILYFFGRSFFDAPKEGLYRLAVDLYKQKMVKKIIVPGTEGERFNDPKKEPRKAHPGKTLMKNRLIGMGVLDRDVVFSDPGYHTRAEGDAFLKYSVENNFLRVFSLTNIYQAPRAMLGLIEKINEDHLPIAVYAVVPDSDTVDWGRLVKGSQGLERKPVFKHLYQEFQGISRYQRKVPPDLASFDEFFKYIHQRGQKTL